MTTLNCLIRKYVAIVFIILIQNVVYNICSLTIQTHLITTELYLGLKLQN